MSNAPIRNLPAHVLQRHMAQARRVADRVRQSLSGGPASDSGALQAEDRRR